jgi:alkylated DNA repair dioxygenase AlkB
MTPPITVIPAMFSDITLDDVIAETQPEQYDYSFMGRSGPRPRRERWYHDDGRSYTYSGVTLQSGTWGPLLMSIRERLQVVVSSEPVWFNSCLVNLYRDGSDYVGWHADDEPGVEDIIASVSFGASRVFKVRPSAVSSKAVATPYTLNHGDVVIMHDGCQAKWQHCIPKTRRDVGPRLSLTFRITR